MAKATVTFICPECGAEYTKSKTCPTRREADSWEQYMAAHYTGVCPDCYRAQKEAAYAAENKTAEEEAKAAGLPELTGTGKQIAWANTIRQEALAMLDGKKPLNEKAAKMKDWMRGKLLTNTAAAWWIDNAKGSLAQKAIIKGLMAEARNAV